MSTLTGPESSQAFTKLFDGSGELDITVLVPALDEQESLPHLIDAVCEQLEPLSARFEILVIDDGSVDDTRKVCLAARELHPQVRVLSFRRNYGKSAALSVGFKRARGSVIITMDADLQDDPVEIPRMLAKLAEGNDLVSGWKQDRKDPFIKNSTSRLFNLVTSLTSGLALHDFNCGFKAYRRELAQDLNVYGELHRYIPVMAHVQGFRVTEIPVRHHARRFGNTKFGSARFLNGLFDLFTILFLSRRRTSPLHFFGRLGLIFAALGGIICGWFLVQWLGGAGLRLRPIMLLGISFLLVALQFFSLGLLAELLVSSRDASESYGILDED